MAIYEIPDSVKELFENGENHYRIIDEEQSGDNCFSMQLFVDSVGIPSEMIVEDYGTQITIFDGTTKLVIDAGGLGDFHMHGYDVSLYED